MRKSTQHSSYQIFEDVLALAGSLAKLGKNITTSKIQSTAEAANEFIHSKVELPNLSSQLSSASENLGQISDYALNTDVKHLVDDASAFARKHPVTTLISVIAAGAVFSRLLLRTDPQIEKVVAKPTKTPAKKTKAKTAKLAVKPRRKANGTTQVHA